uniref:Uncharacterized protein n=1 Tax=Loa loa TaxID=7209 RepID=A0A1I7VIZ0_LOALO
MDIRRYFGGSEGKSALTELRASQGSPVRRNTRCQVPQKKPSKKPLVADVVLSDTCKHECYSKSSLSLQFTKPKSILCSKVNIDVEYYVKYYVIIQYII